MTDRCYMVVIVISGDVESGGGDLLGDHHRDDQVASKKIDLLALALYPWTLL